MRRFRYAVGGTATIHVEDEVEGVELPGVIENLHGTPEDIQMMVNMGFHVDDDNLPTPENIPTADDTPTVGGTDGLCDGQSWGFDGFCDRRMNAVPNINPKLKGVPEIVLEKMTYLDMFLHFFPKSLLHIVITETNKNLNKSSKKEMSLGEFLLFLGIQLFMSTLTGFS